MKKRVNPHYVIVNADDFGLSRGTNLAIEKAYREGILTSASLFVTTPAFLEAVKISKRNPRLGIGIHLSLTWGKSVLPQKEIPLLVDKNCYFYPSYTRLFFLSILSKNFLKQVKKELNAQISKALHHRVRIDHLNSQQHVHMIPQIFSIVSVLAIKHHIKFIRFSKENFWLNPNCPNPFIPLISINVIKFIIMRFFSSFIHDGHYKTPFIGLLYTTRMNANILSYILTNLKDNITEILLHPALFRLSLNDVENYDYNRQKSLGFMKNYSRKIELLSLIDPKIKRVISENKIFLTNFRNL